jgi:hypothetical protein
MEAIIKNQERLEVTYSILAYELTGLQAKYDESQKLLEQTTYMLKLAQFHLHQSHTVPMPNTAPTAPHSSYMCRAPRAASKFTSTPLGENPAKPDSGTDSETDSGEGSVVFDTAVLQPAPKNARTRYTGLFCDLVYNNRTKKMQPSAARIEKTTGLKHGTE